MPFGNLLRYAREMNIETADNRKIYVGPLGSLGLRILGLPHVGVRERARIIMKELCLNGKHKILDAGCGIGLYSLELAKRGYNITGIEIEKDKIETARTIARRAGINIKFLKDDLTNFKIKDKFDLIICSDVLEHIKEDKKVIKNLSKILKKSGKLVITVPKITRFSKNIINYKKFGHVRSGYKKEGLKKELEKNGLKVIKISTYSSSLTRFAFAINERLFKNQFLLGIFFYPLYLLSFLSFLCDKKKDDGLMIIGKKL